MKALTSLANRLKSLSIDDLIHELSVYINYVNTKESTLHQAEKQKDEYKNTYFTTDIKDTTKMSNK